MLYLLKQMDLISVYQMQSRGIFAEMPLIAKTGIQRQLTHRVSVGEDSAYAMIFDEWSKAPEVKYAYCEDE